MLDILVEGDALILKVRVRPKASRAAIVGEHAGMLKLAVTAPPEKGKANGAVVELLAGALGLPKRNIEIVTGTTSRDKTVAIRGATKNAIEALVETQQ